MVDFKKLLEEHRTKQKTMDEVIFDTRTENDLIDKSLLLDMAKVEKTPEFIKGTDVKGAGEVEFKFIDEFQRAGDYNKLTGMIQVIAGEEKFKAKYSMSDKVANKVIDILGDDTTEWVGKSLKFRHSEINGKDSIVLAQETL